MLRFLIFSFAVVSMAPAEIIVTGLTNVAVSEGNPATFSVKVDAAPPISYQWLRNREPIPGANASRYTIPRARLTNDVDLYSVVVSNQSGQVTSEAVLSVLPDLSPPEARSVIDLGISNQFAVFFSEGVEVESGIKEGNYSMDGMTPQRVEALDASVVRLTMARPLSSGLHFLKVKNVRDLAEPPNMVRADSVEVEAGLKLWLTFDDGNSTNAMDHSNQFHLTQLQGGVTPVSQGVRSKALKFDGVDDFVQLPEGMSDFVNGFTVSLWTRPGSLKVWSRFIDFGNGAADDNIIFARMENSSGLFFEVYGGRNSGGKVIATNVIVLNEWQHFAATIDGTGYVALYKNGELLTEGHTTPPRVVNRKRNFIARSNWDWKLDEPYEGEMDELRVYERVLSANEIKALAARN